MTSNRLGFYVNVVALDWWTLTSFSDVMYREFREVTLDEPFKHANRIQYTGQAFSDETGTLFIGSGLQRGATHYMAQISGAMAENNRKFVAIIPDAYHDVNSSRVDIQVTIEQPENWSQWRYFNRMKKKGHPMGWVESKTDGRTLSTVYVGNRKTSHRYYRLYQKLGNDNVVYLRLEVELKRDRSRTVGREIIRNPTENEFLAAELRHLCFKDDKLHVAFGGVLIGEGEPLRVEERESDTLRWILTQTLPAIEKYLWSHDNMDSVELANRLQKILDRYNGAIEL